MVIERRQFLTAAAATVPIVAGCLGGGGGGGSDQTENMDGTTEGQSDRTISMENTRFKPSKASVDTGATVKWVNNDSFEHDVTATQFSDTAVEWSFSETLGGGESTTYTFDQEGVFEYYCTIHGESTMCGAILVGGATLSESLPCASDDGGGYDNGGY